MFGSNGRRTPPNLIGFRFRGAGQTGFIASRRGLLSRSFGVTFRVADPRGSSCRNSRPGPRRPVQPRGEGTDAPVGPVICHYPSRPVCRPT
jgi:hypothetical protein